MLNFDSFIEIKSSNTRNTVSQKYDLTYSPKRELFTLSEAAISNMGIGFQQKGLTVMYNGLDNQVVFITKPASLQI